MAPTLTGPELVRRLTEDLDLTEERVKSYTAETLARHEALQGLTKALAGYPATPRALRDRIGAFIAANDVGTGVVVRRIEDTTGRQFECVVVAGAEEGLLPRRAERRQAARLRNERRRFILGLTRAERQLIVSWAKQRQAVDTEPRRQSRFLQSCKALMTDEIAPDDHDDDSYEGVDPHYYRRDLRAQQAGDAPEPSPTDEDMSGIDAGQRVRHSSYGEGVVQSVEVMENRRIAVIDFQEGGEKKVNLKYARLDVIDE
jgi:DNA helicase-2/ATP-dependent DNA helicase PcrA